METNKKVTKRNTYGVTVGPLESRYKLDLIDIKTGGVEQSVDTDSTISIEAKHYNFGLRLNISVSYNKPNGTVIHTHLIGVLTTDIPQKVINNVFAEYRRVYSMYEHLYDHINSDQLTREAQQRRDLRHEVVKQEDVYKKKLLRDEMKRLAKENVDALRPPLTSLIPKSKVVALDNTIEQEDNSDVTIK